MVETMADNNAYFDENITDDEDFLELVNLVAPMRNPRTYRERENHFEKWSNEEFSSRFRLPKDVVRFLIDIIHNDIARFTNWNHAMTCDEMILLTLRFYATGSMMLVVADFMGVDKSTACRIIHQVSRAIASISNRFIAMPNTEEERRSKATEFYHISRFPKCIGAVDCTHIKIQSPGGNEAETFRNRKGYFSVNVQVVGDASLKIQNVVCRWPGSSHDSTIFHNSRVRQLFEQGYFGNYLLIGDSGYPIKSYLITPLAQPIIPAEQLFNESLIRTRNSIERLFGIWKRRFPILAFGLRVKREKIEAIVIATAVLHNIARNLNLPEEPVDEHVLDAINFMNDVEENYPIHAQGNRIINNATRLALIHNHFARL